MAVNDIVRITIEQRLHGQVIDTVLHYVQTAAVAFPGNEPLSLATRVVATIVPQMKAVQSNELAHVRVIGQKIFPLPPLIAQIVTTGVGAGSVAENSLPTSVAATLTKRTAFAGRKYRGRVFLCGIPVGSEDDSQLSAAAITAMGPLATALGQTQSEVGGGGDWKPILWHRSTSTNDIVTLVEVRPILRNQRRRQVGRGV